VCLQLSKIKIFALVLIFSTGFLHFSSLPSPALLIRLAANAGENYKFAVPIPDFDDQSSKYYEMGLGRLPNR
ncbi:unnamed protein product, partial [Dovyalis caffra]